MAFRLHVSLGDRTLDELRHELDDVVGTVVGLGSDRELAEDASVFVDNAALDVGATQIDADEQTHDTGIVKRLLGAGVFLICAVVVFWMALVHTVHLGTVAVEIVIHQHFFASIQDFLQPG